MTTAIVEGLRVWFIEPKNGFFDTGSVYGRNDDEVRIALLVTSLIGALPVLLLVWLWLCLWPQ